MACVHHRIGDECADDRVVIDQNDARHRSSSLEQRQQPVAVATQCGRLHRVTHATLQHGSNVAQFAFSKIGRSASEVVEQACRSLAGIGSQPIGGGKAPQ